MGKIFDALEKADQKVSDTLRLPKTKNRQSIGGSGEEKIVPIASANRFAEARTIDANLITYHAPHSVETELFKVLRTNLLFPTNGKAAKTILVTSAVPEDGKSFISSNLSISIAQGVEEYVLLVDCDMRKPTIHSIFGFNQGMGLSEYLATGDDIGKMILKTPIEKLSILPAGRPPTNPTELLTSKKMKTLLNEVAARYDDRYVVIDSPPPSIAAETSAIAHNVDGVLIVVRAGKTPRKAVIETVEQIGKEKVLGFVLNHSDQSVKKYFGYVKSSYAKNI